MFVRLYIFIMVRRRVTKNFEVLLCLCLVFELLHRLNIHVRSCIYIHNGTDGSD